MIDTPLQINSEQQANLSKKIKKVRANMNLLESNRLGYFRKITFFTRYFCFNKQQLFNKLSIQFQKLNNLSNQIDSIEELLNKLEKASHSMYINHRKEIQWKEDIEKITKSVYNISIENKKYPNLSSLFTKTSLEKRNQLFINTEKIKYSDFLQTVETQPLTNSQQEAVITNEDSNLILAGAGAGKTSVIVAKIGYLIKKGLAKAEDILVLSYNTKATEELQNRIKERLQISTVHTQTFHSFGNNIISKFNSKRSNFVKWLGDDKQLNACITNIIKEKFKDRHFIRLFKKYFLHYYNNTKSEHDFTTEEDYQDYCKTQELRTLKGDKVKSYEELMISNFLTLCNINHEYEAPYKYDTSNKEFRQYLPDFYLTDYDIYIEHFGVSRKNKTAPFVDNEKYLKGMKWKRKLHKKNKTTLIETFSYERFENNLLKLLEKKLKTHNVTIGDLELTNLTKESPNKFDKLNDLFQVNDFTKLCINFLSLFKANQLKVSDVENKINPLDFKTKSFVNLFQNIYNEYEKQKGNAIDFDDMINHSTNILKNEKVNINFKYVLIDEFQDISIGRTNLIKALLTQLKDCILTVVGDDWQSIYKFSGSDVSVMQDFKNHFGVHQQIFLEDTFRFDNHISKVSSNFIVKNPLQIKKSIHALKQVHEPSIYIYKSTKFEQVNLIKEIFKTFNPQEKISILFLSRFRKTTRDIESHINNLKRTYPNFKLERMTVHGSKGLGYDYVILLGLEKGMYGFPSEQEDDPILKILKPQREDYSFAEERRLFYVALTRAKNKIFLLNNDKYPSPFVEEIISDNTNKEIIESRSPFRYTY